MCVRQIPLGIFAHCALLVGLQHAAMAQQYSTEDATSVGEAYSPVQAYDSDFVSYEPTDGCLLTRPPACFGTANFDVLVLNRSASEHADLVQESTGAILLTTSGLPMGAAAGFRFKWTFESECGTDLQFAYLGSHDVRSSTVMTGADVRGIFFNSMAASSSTSVRTDYESMLDSGEVNLRTRQWRRFAPLAGLRVIQLEDIIEHDSDSGLGRAVVDNELYGVQFGAEGVLFRNGRYTLESTVKAGVFYNNMDVTLDWSNIDFTEHFHRTAFFGEASLFMRFYITPSFSLRAGYQGLWLDGVALLPDQFSQFDAFSTPAPGQGRPDLTTVEYHGGLIGLEATW